MLHTHPGTSQVPRPWVNTLNAPARDVIFHRFGVNVRTSERGREGQGKELYASGPHSMIPQAVEAARAHLRGEQNFEAEYNGLDAAMQQQLRQARLDASAARQQRYLEIAMPVGRLRPPGFLATVM